ncbi:porin [Pelistega sp. MC2]|uniref:porin n=1 Tax=Pelistega sp. MC2 TaxID=1720297 RepID=UPI0008DA87A4|nr:porin [Pelistega sp. MC2]
MKKTLLAAALVAGFAGVAQAESSVTLYGLVDAGLGYSEKKTTTEGSSTKLREIGAVTNIKNGSRWGLKGTEDLGNGTAAIFQLESGFDPATGHSEQAETSTLTVKDKAGNEVGTTKVKQGRLFGRKAIIGLTGESWGTFTVGRQYNVADDLVSGIDPFGTGWGNAGAGSTFGDSISARQSPTFKYLSPNYDGFKFGVGFGYNDEKESANGNQTGKKSSKIATAGVGYNNGGLEVGASFDYDRQKAEGDLGEQDRTAKAWTVAAAYDFNPVKVALGYGQQRDGVINGKFGLADSAYGLKAWDKRGLRAQSWFGGLTFKASETSKIIAGYQGGRIKHNDFDGVRINTHVWSLGYQQDLSKRTHVYVLGSYGQSKWKQENNDQKVRFTQAVVGLQHRF